jgi:phage terminase large subunit-like protein
LTAAHEYASWVLAPENEIKTGHLIKLAAKRFLSDLEREDIYFDEVEAVKCVNFIERYCFQWEGDWRGQPFKLELWQKFHLEQLFGWIRKDTNTRRFTKFYLQIAKKNGKSTECSGIGLFHVYADERINTPKVFTAANNEEQAKICVNMAGRIVEQSEELYEYVVDGIVRLFNYKDNITEIVHTEKDGFIKALSKESSDKSSKTAGGKHGINPSLGLVDEFGMSPDHGASGTISSAMAARKERLMAYFTTAGFNKQGPCYLELRGQGIDVLNGIVKMDNYLPIIYELDAPEGESRGITIDYLLANPDKWIQCNPNLGISVNAEYLKEQLENAKNLGGTTEVDTLTLNFNQWCETPDVWIPPDVWGANAHGIEEDNLIGRTSYGGIELTSGRALNGLSLVFPDFYGDKVAVKSLFWMPEDVMKDNALNIVLRPWVEQGLIAVCPGNVVDNDFIFDKVMDLFRLYNVHSIAHNKSQENHDIIQALIKQGITFNPINTGYSGQTTPTKLWEELLTSRHVEHFGNPVLAWMNSHTQINRSKEGDVRIQKSEGRTCGITACVNALAQWKSVMATEPDDGRVESW